ncbi:hypothetical protein [Actinomadura macrotermitis]|nr:hypothetical protein [Actinomadura macrotermitis]
MAIEIEVRFGPSMILGLVTDPEQRIELFRTLTDVRPQHYRTALAEAIMELADRLERGGDLDGAVRRIDEAIEVSRRVVRRDAGTILARMLFQRARVTLRIIGRHEEALPFLREVGMLPADDGTVEAALRLRLKLLDAYSQGALMERNRDEAVGYLAEYAEALRAAAERDPSHLPDLAMALNNIAGQCMEHDREEGRAAAREAIAIRRRLAADDPEEYLPVLAAALHNLGHLSSRSGDLETARSSLAEAVEIRRSLARIDFARFASPLLRSLSNLVVALASSGPPAVDELLSITTEARELSEAILSIAPDTTHDVAFCLFWFARARAFAASDLPAARTAVDTLLTTYRPDIERLGLLEPTKLLDEHLPTHPS